MAITKFKTILITLTLSTLIYVPVYASDDDYFEYAYDYFDTLQEYEITSPEELDSALFDHYYFFVERGMTFSELEEAIYIYDLVKDYHADYETIDRALYCYDEVASLDVYDEDGNFIDIDPPWYKTKSTPTPTPSPTAEETNIETTKIKTINYSELIMFSIPVLILVCVFIYAARKG